MALPIAAFVLASAGAITTNDHSSAAKSAQTTYYIHKPLATSCQSVSLTCSTTPGEPCMYNDGTTNWQVYNKLNPQAAVCNIQLFRP